MRFLRGKPVLKKLLGKGDQVISPLTLIRRRSVCCCFEIMKAMEFIHTSWNERNERKKKKLERTKRTKEKKVGKKTKRTKTKEQKTRKLPCEQQWDKRGKNMHRYRN